MFWFKLDQIEDAVFKTENFAIDIRVICGRNLTRCNIALEELKVVKGNICDRLPVVIRVAFFERLNAEAAENLEDGLLPIADRSCGFDHGDSVVIHVFRNAFDAERHRSPGDDGGLTISNVPDSSLRCNGLFTGH